MQEKMKKLRFIKKFEKYEHKQYISDCNTVDLRSIFKI